MFFLLLSDCYNLPTSVPFIVNKFGCFVKKKKTRLSTLAQIKQMLNQKVLQPYPNYF